MRLLPSHGERVHPAPEGLLHVTLNRWANGFGGLGINGLPRGKDRPRETSVEQAQRAPCRRSPPRRRRCAVVEDRLAVTLISQESRFCGDWREFIEYVVSLGKFVNLTQAGRRQFKLTPSGETSWLLADIAPLASMRGCQHEDRQVRSRKFGHVYPTDQE